MRSAMKLAACVSIAAAMLCGPVAMAQQAAQGLNGMWVGYYGYTGGGSADRVAFQLKATRAGAAFVASTIEPNTFGTRDALFLTADVAGTVAVDGAVNFTKTYDGSGGQTHSVAYSGAFDASKRCIAGTWKIDTTTGPFKICVDAGLVS